GRRGDLHARDLDAGDRRLDRARAAAARRRGCRVTRAKLVGAALLLVAVAPPPARGNARAETEEARIADILQSALVKHGGDVNRCFEKALADTLDVSGKIELAVDVGEGGRVTKASPASDGVKSPVLLACLTESAATWTLAGIDPGSTVIVPLA